MGISRVQRFKEYRDSLIKEETPVLETPKSTPRTDTTTIDLKETTSTLPMDEVIQVIQSSEEEAVFIKKNKRKKMFITISLCGLALLLVVGIVVFGVIVWR